MALALGNYTHQIQTPPSPFTSMTFSHTVETGDDVYLLVSLGFDSSAGSSGVTGMTYGGETMTELGSKEEDVGSYTMVWVTYGIFEPEDRGANDVVVSFNTEVSRVISRMSQSFTDCGGTGTPLSNPYESGNPIPHSEDITVDEGSMVYACAFTGFTPSTIKIDDSTRTALFQDNVNTQYVGAFSDTGLSAGIIDVSFATTWDRITNARIEIKQAGSSPVTRRIFLIS